MKYVRTKAWPPGFGLWMKYIGGPAWKNSSLNRDNWYA